jgi:hypothetical protein
VANYDGKYLWSYQQGNLSTVKIPLVAPSNVVASNITATATTLSWDAVTGAVSYEIYNGTTLVAATTSSSLQLII